MAQIINSPSLANLTGQSIGTGIAGALNQLAEKRIGDVQRQHAASGLSALGIPHEAASKIVRLPEALQNTVVKNYLQGAENAGLNEALSALGGLSSEQQPQMQSQEAQSVSSQDQMGAPKKKSFEEILKNPRLKPEHRLKIAEMQQRQERFDKQQLEKRAAHEKTISAKQKIIADKETLPVYKEITKASKSADDSDKRLDRIKLLAEKGSLGIPIANSVFKAITKGVMGYGIDLTSFMTADAQELDKLSQDFIKGAKDVFPGRVTDTDLNAYMRTIPNLSQSRAGMLRLVNSMKSFNEAARIRNKTMNDIIKENKGRPVDLEAQIEERAKPELDRLSKEFLEGPQITERLGGGIIRY